MTDKNEIMQETSANEEKVSTQEENAVADNPQNPILPDEEYASEVAKEDPEELEKARGRLMTILRVKCKSLGPGALAQIQPMVYNMSIADCNNMYKVINEKGIFGMLSMVTKHNKEMKKEQNKKS